MCYPENVSANDFEAKVDFISLLDHTCRRIFILVGQDQLKELHKKNLTLIGKWGMDGASSQQTTRQKWSVEHKNANDAFIFIISFVPLQLKSSDKVMWNNDTPNSQIFNRPIKFVFNKEEKNFVLKEYHYYTDLLDKVKTYELTYEDEIFSITFDIKCTMIDGKICNFLTGQRASNCCNICGVGPKIINDLKHVNERAVKTENYKFGMSTLHCWIRCLEYFLHVAYALDAMNVQKKNPNLTKQVKANIKKDTKIRIQKALKELSIVVDVVKQGFGTSNTANVARTFFAKAESVAQVTRLSESLLQRFYVILQVMASLKKINCPKMKNYCKETAELCIKNYPWYKLPPSVHKILIHGSDIIETFELPIGYYSEEPQEANNKNFRESRAKNSRMCSRTSTNLDTIHHLLLTSDPCNSVNRIIERTKGKDLIKEAKMLIIE